MFWFVSVLHIGAARQRCNARRPRLPRRVPAYLYLENWKTHVVCSIGTPRCVPASPLPHLPLSLRPCGLGEDGVCCPQLGGFCWAPRTLTYRVTDPHHRHATSLHMLVIGKPEALLLDRLDCVIDGRKAKATVAIRPSEAASTAFKLVRYTGSIFQCTSCDSVGSLDGSTTARGGARILACWSSTCSDGPVTHKKRSSKAVGSGSTIASYIS